MSQNNNDNSPNTTLHIILAAVCFLAVCLVVSVMVTSGHPAPALPF